MLGATVRILLLALAGTLLAAAMLADHAWWMQHVVLSSLYLPPPAGAQTAVRIVVALVGVAIAGCALLMRRADPAAIGRVLLAIVLALCVAEVGLRIAARPEGWPGHPRLEWVLGVPDARFGWRFVPKRTVRFAMPGGAPAVTYSIDANGDRAPSAETLEDPRAPTLVVTGESIAAGHGLEWKDTFAAQAGERLHAQVVNVAEGGYGNDQALLRAREALARLQRPIALISTVLPVQLHRNVDDSRIHFVLRDGALVAVPGLSPRSRLRELLADELWVTWRIENSLAVTRAILEATAAEARAHGARPLFVVPTFDRAHPEAGMIRRMLGGLPYVVVDLDPARIMPWDGHPDRAGARQIADAVVEALQ
ncbi:MAG: hypothetical protein LC689_06400 [Myxococcales bacterium]|nr:hypothetical protein [Myxococcales bacterium]